MLGWVNLLRLPAGGLRVPGTELNYRRQTYKKQEILKML